MNTKTSIIDFWENNGYLVINKIFSDQECDSFLSKIKQFADEDFSTIINPDRLDFLISQSCNLIFQKLELWQRIEFIQNAELSAQTFRSIMTDVRVNHILQIIHQGKNIAALCSQFLFKELGSKYQKEAWNPHQDNSYLNIKKGCAVNVQLMLSDSNKDNGSLYVYPGSNAEEILPFEQKISYGDAAGNQPGNNCIIPSKYSKIDLEFKKGDLLFLHGNLIHGSYPNLSSVSRPVFAWQTCTLGDAEIALGANRGINAQRREIRLT
jgi:ectoine hydroxylase-related dioxygenase (phytanoyl-CoA dioxygenase family)